MVSSCNRFSDGLPPGDFSIPARSSPHFRSARSHLIAALKHPNGAKKSDHQIAGHVGVSQPMVTKYRQQLSATNKDYQSANRTGRDGRTINTANIGKSAESVAQNELGRDASHLDDR